MTWRAQGMRTWLLQRLSALYMLFYIVTMTSVISSMKDIQFESWRQLFSSPATNIATVIFFLSLLYHAWVGVRDILIDYAANAVIRFSLWTLITLSLIAMSVWIIMILFPLVVL